MSTSPIDARGPQFNATLTSVVLAAALGLAAVGQTTAAVVLLAVQASLFATAVALGVQRTPAAYLFRTYVRPRLGAPTRLEDPRPPRFATPFPSSPSPQTSRRHCTGVSRCWSSRWVRRCSSAAPTRCR